MKNAVERPLADLCHHPQTSCRTIPGPSVQFILQSLPGAGEREPPLSGERVTACHSMRPKVPPPFSRDSFLTCFCWAWPVQQAPPNSSAMRSCLSCPPPVFRSFNWPDCPHPALCPSALCTGRATSSHFRQPCRTWLCSAHP